MFQESEHMFLLWREALLIFSFSLDFQKTMCVCEGQKREGIRLKQKPE